LNLKVGEGGKPPHPAKKGLLSLGTGKKRKPERKNSIGKKGGGVYERKECRRY